MTIRKNILIQSCLVMATVFCVGGANADTDTGLAINEQLVERQRFK